MAISEKALDKLKDSDHANLQTLEEILAEIDKLVPFRSDIEKLDSYGIGANIIIMYCGESIQESFNYYCSENDPEQLAAHALYDLSRLRDNARLIHQLFPDPGPKELDLARLKSDIAVTDGKPITLHYKTPADTLEQLFEQISTKISDRLKEFASTQPIVYPEQSLEAKELQQTLIGVKNKFIASELFKG